MVTISNILQDINNGILANNMVETEFSYRLVYFINTRNGSEKHYLDTPYDGLRAALENIIRVNLSTTNNIMISAVVARKCGEPVPLISRSYEFSLDGYFEQIVGKKEKNTNSNYRRRRAQWC